VVLRFKLCGRTWNVRRKLACWVSAMFPISHVPSTTLPPSLLIPHKPALQSLFRRQQCRLGKMLLELLCSPRLWKAQRPQRLLMCRYSYVMRRKIHFDHRLLGFGIAA